MPERERPKAKAVSEWKNGKGFELRTATANITIPDSSVSFEVTRVARAPTHATAQTLRANRGEDVASAQTLRWGSPRTKMHRGSRSGHFKLRKRRVPPGMGLARVRAHDQ